MNVVNELEILLTPNRGIVQKLTESEIVAIRSGIMALNYIEKLLKAYEEREEENE